MDLPQINRLQKAFLLKMLFWGFFVLVFAYALYINTMMPLVGEDYTNFVWYYHAEPATLIEKVNLIDKVLTKTVTFWSPRIGESLAILLSMFPKVVFNVLNALMFDWLLVVLFSLGYGRFPSPVVKSDLLVLLLLFLLTIWLFPLFGQVFLWKAGVTNHLWATIVVLSFMIPFRLNLTKQYELHGWLKISGYVLLGAMAGLSMENTSAAVFFLLINYFVCALSRKAIDWKWIFPILSFGIGLGYLLLSPGTTRRRLYYLQFRYDDDLTGIHLYLNRLYRIVPDFIRSSSTLLIVLMVSLILFFLLIWWRKHNLLQMYKQSSRNWLALIAMFSTSLLAVLLLTAAPYQSDQRRAFTMFWLLAILLTAILISSILENLPGKLSFVLAGLMGAFLLLQMVQIGLIISKFSRENDVRMEIIDQALKNGDKEVILPAITSPDSRVLETREILSDLGERYAMYYGFDKVMIEK
ncbi:MAG: DUF6056 family protein [Anaerolineaceae bacterium]